MKNLKLVVKMAVLNHLILQREGKNIISKDEFLRGYKINLNDKINAEL